VTGKRQKHNKFLGNFLGMDFGGGNFFSANLSSATIINKRQSSKILAVFIGKLGSAREKKVLITLTLALQPSRGLTSRLR
jgi:hypothetical protein